MYRNCIYCSADLGANESIEHFPVGRQVAFDAGKGRLWAVCPRCARWNLAPIEERWEAVEEAEKRFAATRLRVQRENIGVAKLPDGTRLVRIGRALTGELAAWRYGETLQARRKRYLTMAALGMAVPVALTSLFIAGVVGPGASAFMGVYGTIRDNLDGRRRLYELPAHEGRTEAILIQRRHMAGARLSAGREGEPQVELPHAPGHHGQTQLVVRGEEARRLLERTLVLLNANGARRRQVDGAVDALRHAGSAEDFIAGAAREGRTLVVGAPTRSFQWNRRPEPRHSLDLTRALALEMALHEETERRALEGELTLLEAAWRDAERIAAIADRLATAPSPPQG
ncbi:MAG TPA: hypothetical protein VFJ82_18175 [Longimicrobium sp.]|nr:hypothetical protein [Longimicrobium sp.]